MGKVIHRLLLLVYPAIIFFGLHWFEPRTIAAVLAFLLVLRWQNEAKNLFPKISKTSIAVFFVLFAITITTTITNNELLLRLYPVSVNLGMLIVFASSLIYPPSMIEHLARLQAPNLSIAGVKYTRRATQAWCIFFMINGTIALYTAVHSSREIWSLYNGLIAYLLMGAMFLAEWLVRRHCMAPEAEA